MVSTIEITVATPSDQNEWDSFVLSHPGGSPYHLFAWGVAVNQAYGHQLYYLIARQGKRVVGVLPLVHLHFSFFLNELVALPFCDVGSCLAINSAVEKQLLDEALGIGHQLKVKNVQLRGQSHNEYNSDTIFTKMQINKVRMLLDLPDSSEALFSGFKSKLRSQVRKAEKNGVVFRWAGKDGIDSFYSVFCRNMRDLGSPVHSKRFFHAIIKNFGANGRIGLVEFEGECIGTGLILSTNKLTAIPWASTLRQYNRLAPNMLLYWNCLKFAADNGKKIFDFGRSTKDEGTYRFKKQWGAKPVPLFWYSSISTDSTCSKPDETKPSKRERIAEIWKKIPVPVANSVGPHLRKYINL